MKYIAVFQEDLGVGGIQKSLANLLKNIRNPDICVHLFLMSAKNFWGAELPSKVKVFYLKKMPSFYKFLPFETAHHLFRFDFSYTEVDEYDLAIDFNSYQMSCALAAATIPAKKRIMWIHNNVAIKYREEWKYRVLWNAFKGKFRYFDAFIPCSEALIQPFKDLSGISEKSFTVIQNYIDANEIQKKAQEGTPDLVIDSKKVNFVALGKLCHQKGYDIMLETFKTVLSNRKDVCLYIIGDGPERKALEAQCARNGIANNVTFLGNKENPYAYMQKMDAFVSTSRYEGQPLNIMEARVIGLPLYCSKNLEAYSKGLSGYSDLSLAIIKAEKKAKQPDNLAQYNQEILQKFYALAN